MTQETYRLLESYMLSCMADSAHDKDHVYRVLYHALEIARAEDNVNYDILIAACLLHDIARVDQFRDPSLCHALHGGEKAYLFLIENGFEASFAQQVRHCVRTHRFRRSDTPQTLEAKILFDADKLDVAGAMGMARSLIYKGTVTEPLYNLLPDGAVSDGTDDLMPSFFQEYKFKLEKLYGKFYTKTGKALALARQAHAVSFYENLLQEVRDAYTHGRDILRQQIVTK